MTGIHTIDSSEGAIVVSLPDKGELISSRDVRDPTKFEEDVFPLDFSLAAAAPSTPSNRNLDGLVSISVSEAEKFGPSTANNTSLISEEEELEVNGETGLSQSDREDLSRQAHRNISKLLASRESRENERFARNPVMDAATIRLVAGCVPILFDGRILLISSQKNVGNFMSLPKGGWELDESLEEAAMRETFEEAGVLGILGPPLPSFLIESNRNKSSVSLLQRSDSRSTTASSIPSSSDHDAHHLSALDSDSSWRDVCQLSTLVPLERKPEFHHSHTCITFFPLYVTTIMKDWPENTRERRAYPIQGKTPAHCMRN